MTTKPVPKLKALAPPAANAVPPAPLAVASAFKALHAGTASSHQQQIALQWLVREACGKAHFPYHGEQTHDTAFALGRMFVGDIVVGLFNADLSSLRRQFNVEADSRTS